MNSRRALPTVLLCVCAATASIAQQPATQEQPNPSQATSGLLQRRPQTVAKTRPAPPAPLKAPVTMEAARSPNSNAIYQALRMRTPSGPSFTVKNVVLQRDAGELRLLDGTVTLYNEVNGRVTGAVFTGQGSLHVVPPSAMERHQLKLMMKTEVLDQPFTMAAFAFTDDTAAELKRASTGEVQGVNAMGPVGELQALFRKDLRYDLEERLLGDVLQSKPGGFFMADLKGNLFSKRLLYFVDPHGALYVAPEEVGLLTSGDGGWDVTLGFHSEAQRKIARPVENATFGIKQQAIDVQIERNGKLSGKATALVTANEDGVQVLPLDLYPTLRATGVWGPGGESLDFVQEDKDHDADFAVVLRKPLARGETIQITTAYDGKDVVTDLGNGNYTVNGGARESWYPNVRGEFGNYAYYNLTFHNVKDVDVVATGDKVRDAPDGKGHLSEWQTLAPIPAAGFNLGKFKYQTSEQNTDMPVTAYANIDTSDDVSALAGSGEILAGGMGTGGMLKRATSEGDAAVQIYTDYFGPLDFDHLALTQQSACTYGQSWPMLVYLPICYFWDSTIQHQLGVLDADPTYWKVVTAHEVAHQWWGHTVGFSSYRDQWMSEGFANFSAALFLMRTNKDIKPYMDFWALQRKRLLEKSAEGLRPVDVGPVVMGGRVNSSRAGDRVYQALIYGKGAYILHMLDLLFWTPQYQEAPFKAAMHDFVNTYRNRAATTEDFKATMEKDMPPWIDAEHNHRLDWFFNAYVYGTEVPSYTVASTFEQKGQETTLHMKISQTGVSEDFLMLVPIYLESEDKVVRRLGVALMKGPHDLEQSVNLGKQASPPVRILVNYYDDLLTAN